jgi:transglutaminase-like putative cysteine protease
LGKRPKVTFILILLVITVLFQNSFQVKGEASEKRFTVTSTVTYSNNGTNAWDLTGEDYAISLFMNNSWQSVSLVEHSLPLNSVRTDIDENLLAFLNYTQLDSGQNISYTVKYDVISKPRSLPNITEEQSQTLANISDTLKNEYCKTGGSWLIEDPNLKALAASLAVNETKVLSIVRKLIKWIADNVDYNSLEVPRYPNETYSQKKGDCDDQAILLITLCRILKIPAYLQVGCIFQLGSFPQPQTYWKDIQGRAHVTSVLKQIAWHGWAIVYIPPWGWLPVDLTYVYPPPQIDPLNAIRGAAVVGQDVIQYMNFANADYVGTSHDLRDSIQNSSFYIYMVDEMKMNIDFGSIWELAELLLRVALIATTVIASSLAAIFIYKWKRTKNLET